MPKTQAELDADVLAGAGAPGGGLPGETPPGQSAEEDDDPGDGSIAAEEDEPAAAPGGIQDHEDDAEFLKLNQGRAIPYPVFAKKNEKWKARLTEAEAKYKKDLEAAITKAGQGSGQYTPEQLTRWQRIDGVFGTIGKRLEKMPFLEKAYVALAQGKDPDLRGLQEALVAHLENMPTVDPALAQQLSELNTWREQVEFEREVGQWEKARDEQIAEIKLKHPEIDEGVIAYARKVAAGMAASLPEDAPQSAYPKLTDIAEELHAMQMRAIEADRKKQIPPQNRKPPLGVTTPPGGPPGQKKASMPMAGTPEFAEWIQDPANLAALSGR